MATTPEQAKAFRKRASATDIRTLTDRVEAAIRENGLEHWVSISGFKRGVVETVRDEYIAAGWDVRIVHDQRDGDALVLRG
jgi:hypothetical protein